MSKSKKTPPVPLKAKSQRSAQSRVRSAPPARSVMDELGAGFSERSRQGKRNRAKGAEFERAVATALQLIFPGARREHGQARDGDEVPDVGCTPMWIECTKGSASIYAKLAQGEVAVKATPATQYQRLPVVVVSAKQGSSKMVASMALDDLIDLLDLVMALDSGFR